MYVLMLHMLSHTHRQYMAVSEIQFKLDGSVTSSAGEYMFCLSIRSLNGCICVDFFVDIIWIIPCQSS